jgi:hypothetical protein
MQISIETGREFVRQRQADGAGNAVINRSLACLRRMLKLAYEERKVQSLPVIRLLKDPPRPPRVLGIAAIRWRSSRRISNPISRSSTFAVDDPAKLS